MLKNLIGCESKEKGPTLNPWACMFSLVSMGPRKHAEQPPNWHLIIRVNGSNVLLGI